MKKLILLLTLILSTGTAFAFPPVPPGTLLPSTCANGQVASFNSTTGKWDTCSDNAGGTTIATDTLWDAAGDLVYGTGANTGGKLAAGTAYQVLMMNSGATAPAWTSTLGVTGTRLTKGWFADLEVTNAIAGSITGNAATATALAADPADCAAGQLATGIAASGALTCTATPSLQALTLTGANTLGLGTASTSTGSVNFKNATNANLFTITSGVSGAALAWTLPTAAPGGANYLLNVDADGTMGYTDPASLGGGSGDVTDVGNCTGGACLDGSSDGGSSLAFYDGTGNKLTIAAQASALGADKLLYLPTTATDGQFLKVGVSGNTWTLSTDAPAGSGDVIDVGDCSSGACLDGSSDGGTYVRLYDGDSHYTAIVSSNVSANTTITLPATTGTLQLTDTELTAIAGLTFADASIIQLTGDGAAAVLTSGGNNRLLGSNSDNSALEFKSSLTGLTFGGFTASRGIVSNASGELAVTTGNLTLGTNLTTGTGAVTLTGNAAGSTLVLPSGSLTLPSAVIGGTYGATANSLGKRGADATTVAASGITEDGTTVALGALDLTSTGFIALGADPADTGSIRLPNAGYIYAEADAAGTDVSVIGVDSGEIVQIAASGASGVTITPATTITGVLTTGTNIELGNASDTTLSRVSAGVVAVEGNTLATLANPIFTGVVDIPVNATTDAEGEITIDTTTDQLRFYGAAQKVIPTLMYTSFVIPAPADTDDINIMKAPYGMTIAGIDCIVQGTTSATGQLQECASDGTSCADLDSDIACDADGAADDGTLTDSAIASGAWLRWKTTSLSGTPTFLTVTVKYRVVAD